MTKKLLYTAVLLVGIGLIFKFFTNNSENESLKQQHAEFFNNHPYQKTMSLAKKVRKSMGLPPNAFIEQEFLHEMSPLTGKTYPENIFKIQKKISDDRTAKRVPGDGSDNPWIERGPNNVAGRVRAVMFDPNDTTNETVFAGSVSGGLWRNDKISDPNSTWVQVDIPDNLSISSLTYDPHYMDVFYAGAGECYVGHTTGSANGDGLWKSSDRGATWTNIFGGVTGKSFFQSSDNITVLSPDNIKGNYISFPTTAFGTLITTAIVNKIVLANDGTGTPTGGCNALTNASDINGKIALIRRGGCDFDVKVKNAENAGAIAVIVMNNIAGDPVPMGGDDTTIAIPSIMISQADGDMLETALASGDVEVSLNPSSGTFTAVVVPGPQHINDVVVRKNNEVSEIYVGVSDAVYGVANATTVQGSLTYGLYKSVDGGASWTKLSLPETTDGNPTCPNDLEIGADNKIWLSSTNSKIYNDGGGRVFSSTDGVTFNETYAVPNGNRTEIALSATNADKIYLLAQLTAGGSVAILKTEDAFSTDPTATALPNDADSGITAADFTRGQAFYDLLIAVNPTDDDNVYVGGIDLFKTTDGGANWDQFSHWYGGFNFQEVHADQHIAVFGNGETNKMLFGNDGGVYYTDNGGTVTGSRNNGLNITQFYSVGVGPTAAFDGKEYFAAGAQDNGTQSFEDSNTGVDSSIEAYGGDGAYTFFDQDGTDKYFIRNYVYNDGINLYNLATGSSKTINSESSSNGDFINQEELDSNLNILYTNYSGTNGTKIKRYSNLLSGFIFKTELTNSLMTSAPAALTVSPYTTTSTTLLVGTKLGDLLKVTNANATATWTEISGPSFVGSISDIEFGVSEDEIFVTMHNYNVVSIWYTDDAGATWHNKEGNFPDIPVKAILQNPLNLEEVIIGTELGVWRTANFSDSSPVWVQSFNGMKNVKVLDLDLRDDNTVFAATHGRGIFSGKFDARTASVDAVLNEDKSFTVYPTVSNGSFTIFAKSDLGASNVVIFDINGKQVYKTVLDFNDKEKQDVSVNLNAGVYIVNVIDSNNKKSSNKIVIE